MNSDIKTEVQPGDGQAYEGWSRRGMRGAQHLASRSVLPHTRCDPNSGGGAASQFDHKVDHIMTDPRTR